MSVIVAPFSKYSTIIISSMSGKMGSIAFPSIWTSMKLVSKSWIVVSFQDQNGESKSHPWSRNLTRNSPNPLATFPDSLSPTRFFFCSLLLRLTSTPNVQRHIPCANPSQWFFEHCHMRHLWHELCYTTSNLCNFTPTFACMGPP